MEADAQGYGCPVSPNQRHQKEKYSIQDYQGTDEFAELMKFMPLDVALGAYVFLSFRKRIVKQYPKIFAGGGQDDGLTMGGQFRAKWGWYHSIYRLANGEILNFDQVTRQSLHKCLTYLSYEIDKQKVEQNELNKSLKR
ncbi:hypothetical protein D8Z79_025960 (plasmid) [Escherichia fergusonii]|uniref:hypothetical protein n=1 Tax=Escherichia fergusonii TaxID=564 RepID=UPI00111A721D|nr:hypothetical protein [Escherichia fergusonii]QCZ35044.1 hypothetical protein D8Z79_025730 [Escherichia fergusonii]QCZ35088.1 hypothetical protein D8Z79_025960 [Escherichia fergusonii]